MSEHIKITIVMYDEKPSIENSRRLAGETILTQASDVTLMPLLLKNGLMDGSFCGGRGDCGRCVVQFLKGAPLPVGLERNRLTPDELRQGYRLACVTKPKADCTVRIVKAAELETPIVTVANLLSENIDFNGQEKSLTVNQKTLAMQSDMKTESESENGIKKSPVISETKADVIENSGTDGGNGGKSYHREERENGRYIIAVDLGTTTIAMQLREMGSGAVADTYCEMNPQGRYGTDVLSRIQASCAGNGEELRRLVCGAFLRGLWQFAEYLHAENASPAYVRHVADEAGRRSLREAACGDNVASEKEAVCGYYGAAAHEVGCGKHEPLTYQAGRVNRGSGEIVCMCIAGNTTMQHLLLGYDVEGLGKSPFQPVETGLQKLTMARLFSGLSDSCGEETAYGLWRKAEFPVYIAPCISAFVGGDIVAGLYALGLLPQMAGTDSGLTVSRQQDDAAASGRTGDMASCGQAGERHSVVAAFGQAGERHSVATESGQAGEQNVGAAGCERVGTVKTAPAVLLIDLGTNGEMAITDGERMVVTATAAGPAFEGGGALIGTDRIALTAALLRRGILDETGLLAEPYFTEGVRVEPRIENTCYYTNKDIRALQMAKAAIRAGVEILWEEMGRPAIARVYLAGGFGYYLDVEAAVTIGLLPAALRGRVQAAGNTSLAGAYLMGRDLSKEEPDIAGLERRLVRVESINLAKRESFERLYLQYMNLEEN